MQKTLVSLHLSPLVKKCMSLRHDAATRRIVNCPGTRVQKVIFTPVSEEDVKSEVIYLKFLLRFLI